MTQYIYPIYCCYDSDITTDEENAIVSALKEFKALFPEREIRNYGRSSWGNGSYNCADWYVQHTDKINKLEIGHQQLDAESMLSLLMNEPWQKKRPHIDVVFVSDDITMKRLNFCFGAACGRVTVQSVYRYRHASSLNEEEKALAIKAVVLHELGHTLNMAANPYRRKTEPKLGIHCAQHGCIMQQGMNVPEFIQHAKDARALDRWYCPLCLADAKRHIAAQQQFVVANT